MTDIISGNDDANDMDALENAGLDEGMDEAANETLEKAERMGFISKDDWEGDPDLWVDKDVYVATKPLRSTISVMNKAMAGRDRKIQSLNDDLVEMMSEINNQNIAQAKSSRRDASDDDDHTKVDELNDEIARLTAQAESLKNRKQYAPINPQVEEFKGRNPWYESDSGMTDFANSLATTLSNRAGGWNDSILGEVEKMVRKAYPEKFTNTNRDKPSSVGNGGRGVNSGSKYTAKDLDPDTLKMMGIMKRNGMSNKDYIKKLEDQGYFGG